jgi:hypothetical protein
VCRLPKDGGVPPKHVAVNKNISDVHLWILIMKNVIAMDEVKSVKKSIIYSIIHSMTAA